jgi:hypothetical protein
MIQNVGYGNDASDNSYHPPKGYEGVKGAAYAIACRQPPQYKPAGAEAHQSLGDAATPGHNAPGPKGLESIGGHRVEYPLSDRRHISTQR